METDDRHYFFEGLFIIVFTVAAGLFFVWLGKTGHRDDVLYRIRFAESVNGLAVGDEVKFRGVDIGSVQSLKLNPNDSRYVLVDVKLRNDAPITTDTKATLKMKGITGGVSIELTGGSPGAQRLAAVTPPGEVPMIPSEKSAMTSVFEELPKVVKKFAGLETQAQKALSDVTDVTKEVKEDPSLLLRGRRKKE
jgi:phospholipid/cholesterol/gamma-HCH transport system substrate-binding protein